MVSMASIVVVLLDLYDCSAGSEGTASNRKAAADSVHSQV